MSLSQTSSSRMIYDLMPPQRVILESRDGMNVVDGATTEPRTRINQPDDESARCKASKVPGQPNDFSPPTQLLTTPSMFNAISFQHERTGLLGGGDEYMARSRCR